MDLNSQHLLNEGVSKLELRRPEEKEAVCGSKDFQAADF